MDMEKKKRIILITVIGIIVLILLALIGYLVIININKNKSNQNIDDIYNKTLFVNAKLPNISGSNNVMKDEFGTKTNISESVNSDKKWMNLDFTDFEVYSSNSKTSVIKFKITNNNYMIIEPGKFQILLKDDSGQIVSLVDFDELSIPSSATIDVTVDVTGDISNVKDIVIDEINYKMTF